MGTCVVAAFWLLAAVATAQVVIQPDCYSTTDEYLVQSLVVPVQPQSPTTIQRYQGPQIKIFCVSFNESGPTCATSGNSVPRLCSRPTADSSQSFTCELLTDFALDVNARITRGTMNGIDMTWLLQWDGTSLSLSCYPRVVEVRMLVLVYEAANGSTALFAILLIVVIFVVLMMAVAFYAFLINRYRQSDEAGAVTIGGPGATFRGPQMAVTAPNANNVGHTKILLPVREGDAAITDMQNTRFGGLSRNIDEEFENEMLSTRGPRSRRSPPAPGDGVRDGMFPSPRRGMSDDDEWETSPSGRRRRRRGGRGSRGGRGRYGDGERPREGAVFPTQTEWETAEPGGEGNADGSRPIGLDSRYRTVKYIPRWMQGNFGRGGAIPEVGDGEDDPAYQRASRDFTASDLQGSASKPFGVYRASPKRQTDGEDENAPGSGDRFGSGLKRRRGGQGLKEVTPNARRELGYGSEDDGFGRRGRRRGASGRRADRLTRGYDDDAPEDTEHDNFQRNRAKLSSGADFDGTNLQASPGRGVDKAAFGSRSAGSAPNQTGAEAFTCKHCHVVLNGTSADPPFCVVTGERHT